MTSAAVFRRPPTGWVGDVIPYLHEGRFHLFYLHDTRDAARPGTSWNRYVTEDFVHYEDRGTALPHGGPEDADLNAYTGCVIEAEGVHHLFYTGHNPAITAPGTDVAQQVVMHATSSDGMESWVKHPEHTFGPPPEGYDPADWRDPFVFHDGRQWRMLLAARSDAGPSRRRGLIAQCVSDDLISWRTVEPFWAPGRYVTHECPDLFQIGDLWYLVYSEFSERYTTRYRISESPEGPWRVPEHDTVDGRAFYASKTVERDGRRFFVGWIATRENQRDEGPWQWAGELAVHETAAREDGTLRFFLPQEIRASFSERVPTRPTPVSGEWREEEGAWSSRTLDGHSALRMGQLPEQCLVRTVITIEPETSEAGVVIRASDDLDQGYVIRLEPKSSRMVFDRWPRPLTGPLQWQISGDVPQLVELERAADLRPGTHVLELLVDGDACITYLDGSVAMSARIYDRESGAIGMFVGEGGASFSDVSIHVRPSDETSKRRKI